MSITSVNLAGSVSYIPGEQLCVLCLIFLICLTSMLCVLHQPCEREKMPWTLRWGKSWNINRSFESNQGCLHRESWTYFSGGSCRFLTRQNICSFSSFFSDSVFFLLQVGLFTSNLYFYIGVDSWSLGAWWMKLLCSLVVLSRYFCIFCQIVAVWSNCIRGRQCCLLVSFGLWADISLHWYHCGL